MVFGSILIEDLPIHHCYCSFELEHCFLIPMYLNKTRPCCQTGFYSNSYKLIICQINTAKGINCQMSVHVHTLATAGDGLCQCIGSNMWKFRCFARNLLFLINPMSIKNSIASGSCAAAMAEATIKVVHKLSDIKNTARLIAISEGIASSNTNISVFLSISIKLPSDFLVPTSL